MEAKNMSFITDGVAVRTISLIIDFYKRMIEFPQGLTDEPFTLFKYIFIFPSLNFQSLSDETDSTSSRSSLTSHSYEVPAPPSDVSTCTFISLLVRFQRQEARNKLCD